MKTAKIEYIMNSMENENKIFLDILDEIITSKGLEKFRVEPLTISYNGIKIEIPVDCAEYYYLVKDFLTDLKELFED